MDVLNIMLIFLHRFSRFLPMVVALLVGGLARPLYADPQEAFLTAARKNNLKQAQKIFSAGGVEINVADAKGKNAVLYACQNGAAPFLAWLVENQADLAVTDPEANSCYHLATNARNPKAVFALLAEKGIDINAKNSQGRTALALAVANGKKVAFDELIRLQADPNAADAEEFTPLTIAFDKGNVKFFETLLQVKANPDVIYPKTGRQLLLEAVKKERIAFAKLLIEAGANLSLSDEKEDNLPVICTRQTLPDLLPVLISKGFSVETKDSSGKTLLQIAHENNLKRLTAAREKLFGKLLELGANPNTLSVSGRSILQEQAENGHYNLVKLLIERGADLNFRDKAGNTVLHATANRNQFGVMRLLVEKFTDLNLPGDSGNTAAHFAARSGGTGILKLLKEKGANLELKNNAGETPLSIAIGKQDVATTRALLALGASLSDEGRETPLMLEIAKSGVVNAKTVELLSLLSKSGANINAVNRYGNNALAYALSRKNLRMAEALLKAGAKSEAGDFRGNTLLHKLALHAKFNRLKNQELADWIHLVLSYQHPDFQNSAGETALHIIANDEYHPDLEAAQQFFETLVNYSAGIALKNAKGRSVADLARRMGWENLAAANLPGEVKVGLAQPLQTAENDKILQVVAGERSFFAIHTQGKVARLLHFSQELELQAAQEIPGLTAIAATREGVLIAGTKPGEVDGTVDTKCRQGQNLVIFVARLDTALRPQWEHTWGRSGSCARTKALSLTSDKEGNAYILGEFAGKLGFRRLSESGAYDGYEFATNNRATEIVVLEDGNIALPAKNLLINGSDGSKIGRIIKSRNWRVLALNAAGTRYLAGDFGKLAFRKGVELTAEDAEGKIIWKKQFAGAANMTIEQMTANHERVCVAGKTDGALHGQENTHPGKLADYYVLCSATNSGTRLFTRILPAEGLKLVALSLNYRGDLMLAFSAGPAKSTDIILARIDHTGRVFR